MKLYEAPRDVWLRCTKQDATGALVPPSAMPVDAHRRFKKGHIDGMYSYCTDEYGHLIHPAAWTEVEIVENPTMDQQRLSEVVYSFGSFSLY